MLRFQTCPDRVFLAIFHDCLEWTCEHLRHVEDTYRSATQELKERDEFYRAMYPRMARFFTRDEALDSLERLLSASKQSTLYQITDFHWLILYEAIEVYCEVHNDMAKDSPDRTLTVGPYEVGQIDFDFMVDHFFWDTDFLASEEFLDLSHAQRHQQLGVSDEAYSIAAGLKPHPDELRIVPWPESDWGRGDMTGPERGRVPVYPPEGDGEGPAEAV